MGAEGVPAQSQFGGGRDDSSENPVVRSPKFGLYETHHISSVYYACENAEAGQLCDLQQPLYATKVSMLACAPAKRGLPSGSVLKPGFLGNGVVQEGAAEGSTGLIGDPRNGCEGYADAMAWRLCSSTLRGDDIEAQLMLVIGLDNDLLPRSFCY